MCSVSWTIGSVLRCRDIQFIVLADAHGGDGGVVHLGALQVAVVVITVVAVFAAGDVLHGVVCFLLDGVGVVHSLPPTLYGEPGHCRSLFLLVSRSSSSSPTSLIYVIR